MKNLTLTIGRNEFVGHLRLSFSRMSLRIMKLHWLNRRCHGSFFDEKGIALIETIVAVGILGTVAIAVLSGLGTSTNASVINEKRVIAESLVRSEIEYVKQADYSISGYPVDSTIPMPEGWVISPPEVQPLHETEDGIQKVIVTARFRDKTVLSVTIYKVDR